MSSFCFKKRTKEWQTKIINSIYANDWNGSKFFEWNEKFKDRGNPVFCSKYLLSDNSPPSKFYYTKGKLTSSRSRNECPQRIKISLILWLDVQKSQFYVLILTYIDEKIATKQAAVHHCSTAFVNFFTLLLRSQWKRTKKQGCLQSCKNGLLYNMEKHW